LIVSFLKIYFLLLFLLPLSGRKFTFLLKIYLFFSYFCLFKMVKSEEI